MEIRKLRTALWWREGSFRGVNVFEIIRINNSCCIILMLTKSSLYMFLNRFINFLIKAYINYVEMMNSFLCRYLLAWQQAGL